MRSDRLTTNGAMRSPKRASFGQAPARWQVPSRARPAPRKRPEACGSGRARRPRLIISCAVSHDLSTRGGCNAVRMFERPGQGHYESFFVRGNHPTAPLAFWIRYTLLVPKARPGDAVAELWAIVFDGERNEITAVKESHPLQSAVLGRERFSLRIGAASFEHGSLRGSARTEHHRIAWALDYEADAPPLLLLPEAMYEGSFPKAKSLVSAPGARFRGA